MGWVLPNVECAPQPRPNQQTRHALCWFPDIRRLPLFRPPVLRLLGTVMSALEISMLRAPIKLQVEQSNNARKMREPLIAGGGVRSMLFDVAIWQCEAQARWHWCG